MKRNLCVFINQMKSKVIAPFTHNSEKEEIKPPKSIKILAIGNSFSVDAMGYLYQILRDAGVKKIILGNLYIGGCSLATHLENARENKCEYKYYKNTNGEWVKHPEKSINYGIADERWDFITMQQASGYSGVESSYGETLRELVQIVKSKKPKKAKLIWHGTWAYQNDSTHRHFLSYDCNQQNMYEQIICAINNQIVNNPDFVGIIPNTTAIQNLRTSFLGDTITRDGFHLSLDIGRYTAGLTFFTVLAGVSVDNIKYNPAPDVITAEIMAVIKESVKNAVEKPFEVTKFFV